MCIPPKNSFASLVCRRGELPVGGANSNSKAEVAVEVVIDSWHQAIDAIWPRPLSYRSPLLDVPSFDSS